MATVEAVRGERSYYSDLARLSDGTIVLLYGCEGDIPSFPRRIALARFDLEWLTQGGQPHPRRTAWSSRTRPVRPGGTSAGS